MKFYLVSMGLLFPLILIAQVNRYMKPAKSTFQDTYVSPDYGLLLDIATEIRKKEDIIKKNSDKDFIKEWLSFYQSCVAYPQSISDGWHNVYIIHFENETIINTEMYVSSNKVIAIRTQDEVIPIDNIPIKNGCCKIPTSSAYFYDEIKRTNQQKGNNLLQSPNEALELVTERLNGAIASFVSYPENHENTQKVYEYIEDINELYKYWETTKTSVNLNVPEIKRFYEKVETWSPIAEAFEELLRTIVGKLSGGIEGPTMEILIEPVLNDAGWTRKNLNIVCDDAYFVEYSYKDFKMLFVKNTRPKTNYNSIYPVCNTITVNYYYDDIYNAGGTINVGGGLYRMIQFKDDKHLGYYDVVKSESTLTEQTTSSSIVENFNPPPTNANKTRIPIIKMRKMSGNTFLVSCKVNELPLDFIFDTGASSVTLSRSTAIFMLKKGYLSIDDIVGQNTYQMADGNISVGTVIRLKKIEIGGYILHNVEASIIDSDNAPLLLGQSALNKLGKIQIDYNNSTLTIIK